MSVNMEFQYGSALSEDRVLNGLREAVATAEFAPELAEAAVKALYAKLREYFDDHLPTDFTWVPRTSSIIGPADRGDELPNREEAEALLVIADDELTEHFDEILTDVQATFEKGTPTHD